MLVQIIPTLNIYEVEITAVDEFEDEVGINQVEEEIDEIPEDEPDGDPEDVPDGDSTAHKSGGVYDY